MDRRLVYGGPSPPFVSLAWSMYSECTCRWPARGVFPYFSRGGAPASGELAVSLYGGAGV